MQCCRVEPWIFGWSWIKFDDEKEKVKRPHLGYRRCAEEAVYTCLAETIVFHWCKIHSEQPNSVYLEAASK